MNKNNVFITYKCPETNITVSTKMFNGNVDMYNGVKDSEDCPSIRIKECPSCKKEHCITWLE